MFYPSLTELSSKHAPLTFSLQFHLGSATNVSQNSVSSLNSKITPASTLHGSYKGDTEMHTNEAVQGKQPVTRH